MSIRPLLRLIGSWWLTAALLSLLTSAYLVFSLDGNPYPAWLEFLFHSGPGIALYSALTINIAAATIRIVVDRMARPAVTPETIRAMDEYTEFPINDDRSLHMAAGLLKERLSAQDIRGQGMRHVTGRLSFLPGAVFRFGLVMTLLALQVSVHTRRSSDAVFHENEERSILGSPITVTKISANLPGDFLQVGDDTTFRLDRVSVTAASAGASHRITPGFPTRISGAYYRVRHVGFAQPAVIAVAGRTQELTVDLDVLPPGRTSILSLASGDSFFTFSLEPDRTITKGLVTGRQYDLTAPRYRVTAQRGNVRGKQPSAVLRPGSRAAVGPASIALGRPGLSVRIQATSDPALPFLYAGMLILLAGLGAMLSRFFWYEREFALSMDGTTLIMGCRDEFFKKWGILRFQRWTEGLQVAEKAG
ncbi:MAG: hypothetical protein OEW15_08620 [Nitrospirota bacterium]|nr:hypothetical protein [Nitrospirota bacterium]